MNYLRYHGIDLPIYPEEEVLQSKSEYRRVCEGDATNFTRIARTSGPTESLMSRLNRGEWYFDKIGELCKIKIVPHTYGLCRDTDRFTIDRRFGEEILPKGYLLVANVAIIKSAGELPDNLFSNIATGVKNYFKTIAPDTAKKYSYKDVGIHQIVYGTRAGTEEDTAAWHVDVDSLVGTQQIIITEIEGKAFTEATITLG